MWYIEFSLHLVEDIMFLGTSFQKTKCSQEWIHTCNFKCKTTRMLLWYSVALMRTHCKARMDQYSSPKPFLVQKSFMHRGCSTQWAALHPLEPPRAVVRHCIKKLAVFPWLLQSIKSWREVL